MVLNQYIYSRLSPESVQAHLEHHYDLSPIKSCVFYVFGLHDNYLVKTEESQFILRLYRNQWRNADEVFFELELLNYLKQQAQAVASPLHTKAHELAFEIQSPEGVRFSALFNYADGKGLTQEISTQESELLGTTIANIHSATGDFKTTHKRNELNLTYLLDESVELIAPFINAEKQEFLTEIQKKLHKQLLPITQSDADFGICIGDVNQSNFHINTSKQITVFDFDQCGYGYRAFEVGKFSSSLFRSPNKKQLTKAFLKGYETVRKLSTVEKNAIPYFEIAATIWVMSIRVANEDKVGHLHLEEGYWNQRFAILEALDKQVS
ncbi:phosphotransferase [Leucothrix arctica]|uniref:phosphotransferase n=1 Tax=Leucothrix arctica TaxID=1481894 RepID=UPI001304A1E5|nr:phosphotransferase [Leucothrix arctica]